MNTPWEQHTVCLGTLLLPCFIFCLAPVEVCDVRVCIHPLVCCVSQHCWSWRAGVGGALKRAGLWRLSVCLHPVRASSLGSSVRLLAMGKRRKVKGSFYSSSGVFPIFLFSQVMPYRGWKIPVNLTFNTFRWLWFLNGPSEFYLWTLELATFHGQQPHWRLSCFSLTECKNIYRQAARLSQWPQCKKTTTKNNVASWKFFMLK